MEHWRYFSMDASIYFVATMGAICWMAIQTYKDIERAKDEIIKAIKEKDKK